MVEFPVYSRSATRIESAHGYKVVDENGRQFIDFYGGHAVALLGYQNQGLLKALSDQATQLFFQSNSVNLRIREAACASLIEVAPPGLNRVFLVNSGAEANENALRLACRVTRRRVIVALEGAFHGRTAACAAVTDHSESWYGFPNQPFDVIKIPVEDVEALRSVMTEEVAAFIFEPVQGVAGAVTVSDHFLQEARKLCTEMGALMIADEVQTGMGRTGKVFAVEHARIVPDLLTVAKGLAAGFPAGALLAPSKWADDLPPGALGTTFGGGPMACALILEVLKQVQEPSLLSNVTRLSQRLQTETLSGPVRGVSGRGFLLGLHVNRPASEVLDELREHGIIAGDAKNKNVVRLLPPLILDDEAVDTLASALREIGA